MDLSKLTPSLEFQDQRLKYLFLSYQLGSMRAAADQLGIAPSSVSRQINLLQTELSIDLIEAGTHRIRLTEAGLVTVDYYRARASQHEALLNRLDDLRGQHLGKTVVAVGEGLFGAQLIGKLQSFFKSYPGLRTEILIAPTLEVQHMVMEDQAQIGVLFAPIPTLHCAASSVSSSRCGPSSTLITRWPDSHPLPWNNWRAPNWYCPTTAIGYGSWSPCRARASRLKLNRQSLPTHCR